MRGCICPHPPLLVPQIGGGHLDAVVATSTAMHELATAIGEPETLVVISPHAAGFAGTHTVRTAPSLHGDFGDFRCPEVRVERDNDLQLVAALLEAASEADLPLVGVENPVLDHGTLVPLYFLGGQRLVVLSIVEDYAGHARLGELVRRCVQRLGRDAVFVASGDMSHRLVRGAPAGFDPRGAQFDRRVVELVTAGDLAGLREIEPDLRAAAGECGLRSFIALSGYLGESPCADTEVFSYEGPYGVGYLVAGFGLTS
jgi:AmmeMemoRadiSam system protein B